MSNWTKIKHRYPPHWSAISHNIRFGRARGRCESCGALHGQRRLFSPTQSAVILACAHLDHDPAHNRATNLRALCQECHLHHDRADNLKRAALTRFLKRLLRQPSLFISTQGTPMPHESAPFLLIILGEHPCLLCQRLLTQADADVNTVLGFGLGEQLHFACLHHFFTDPQGGVTTPEYQANLEALARRIATFSERGLP
ncbi:MAG: hypothetical protein JNM09_07265 [Blastocatellia bacterium]|nr:hypothetical protein [Blastocatellia bacterium]